MKFSAMLVTFTVQLVAVQVVHCVPCDPCVPCPDYDFRIFSQIFKRIDNCEALNFFDLYDECAGEL